MIDYPGDAVFLDAIERTLAKEPEPMTTPNLYCTECAEIEGEVSPASHVCGACGCTWCARHHSKMEDGEGGGCCESLSAGSDVPVAEWAVKVSTALRLMRAAPVAGRG